MRPTPNDPPPTLPSSPSPSPLHQLSHRSCERACSREGREILLIAERLLRVGGGIGKRAYLQGREVWLIGMEGTRSGPLPVTKGYNKKMRQLTLYLLPPSISASSGPILFISFAQAVAQPSYVTQPWWPPHLILYSANPDDPIRLQYSLWGGFVRLPRLPLSSFLSRSCAFLWLLDLSPEA
jgi:hypothetical protein